MKKILSIITILILGVALVACQNHKIPVSGLTITVEHLYLNVDSTLELEVKVIPVDATDKTLKYEIVDTAVATVSSDGKVTGITLGNTTLKVSASSDSSIFKEIDVHVVNKNWPLSQIEQFAGFTLPEFPNYTAVEVIKEDHTLKLIISGTTGDVNQFFLSYKDALTHDGWIADSYDNHSGNLTHPDYELVIDIHNEFIHNGNTIELVISEEGHDHHGDHDHNHEEDHDHHDDHIH